MRTALVLAIAAFALVVPSAANAAPPANDDFAAASNIASAPFSDSVQLDGASTGEPQICNFQTQSVWYRYSPASPAGVRIDMDGSSFGVVFNLYRAFGTGLGLQVRKRVTPFAFSYTFTPDDATIGNITFKAIAALSGARDALPADNEIVSLPTKVN